MHGGGEHGLKNSIAGRAVSVVRGFSEDSVAGGCDVLVELRFFFFVFKLVTGSPSQ